MSVEELRALLDTYPGYYEVELHSAWHREDGPVVDQVRPLTGTCRAHGYPGLILSDEWDGDDRDREVSESML